MCNVTPPQPGQPPSRYSRKNGFSLPINYLQVTAWGAEVFLAFLLFGVEILALPKQVWTPVFVFMGVIYVAHGLSLLIATAINPADDNAKQRLNNRQGPLPTFDRTKHNHVIENSYCHICEVSVKMKSKHCSACNKCVAVFDHHCKWLNNCVGEKNYKVFLFTVISALVLGLGMLVISLFVFIHAVQNFTGLNSDVWWKTPTATLIAFDVLIAVKVVITLLCLILLFQLFFFHMMLVYKGLTTYDYIKRNLARSAAKQVSRSSSPSPSMENGAICNAPLEIVENTQPDPNLVGQNVATVDVNQGGTVKSDLPKHALLKGSKIKNYGENPCNEPEISSHKNHVFVNDSSEKPVQFSNSQNNKLSSLNYSHKSNLNKSKFEENKESVELPHVVPDSSETSRQKRQTKVPANNKSRPLPPLVVNANCKFLSENQANLKKLPPIASNIPVV